MIKVKAQRALYYWLIETKAPALCDFPSTTYILDTCYGRLVAVAVACTQKQLAKYSVREYKTQPCTKRILHRCRRAIDHKGFTPVDDPRWLFEGGEK